MGNKFRLQSATMFSRTDDELNEPPLRIVFLSVEGNKTERQYFEYVQNYKEKLGIKARVYIHTLQRAKNDNLSAPQNVLELLEEYVELRKNDTLPERLKNVVPKEYSEEFIRAYLNSELNSEDEKVKLFEAVLEETGYDVVYNRYLRDFKGENDVFGIVLDRDYKSHSVLQMQKIVQECQKKGYKVYITNPLFEFWLLLHLTNIKSFSAKELECIRVNDRVSERHTYTSRKVSELAGHSKSISEKIFREYYLPNIDYAIEQAKGLTGEIGTLIGNNQSDDATMGEIGSNFPELFEILRADNE